MVSAARHTAQHAADRLQRGLGRTMAWLMLLTALAMIGAQAWTARETLRLQAVQQGELLARRAAGVIESAGGVAQKRDAVLHALFEEQRLRRLELVDGQGNLVFQRQTPPGRIGPLAALDQALRPHALLADVPVQLQGPGAPAARLRVETADPDTGTLVWRALWQSSLAWVVALMLPGAWAVWKVKRLRKDTDRLALRMAEANAALGRVTPIKVRRPELSEEMAHLQSELKQRADELEQLRRAAVADPLTGLPKRAHFLARLEQALEGEGAWPVGTLLLLRVRDLEGINRRVGHDAGNHLLQGLARHLRALLAADQSTGGLVGRLNGADFAVLLPGTSAAGRKARLALNAGRELIAGLDPQAGLVVAAVDLMVGLSVNQAMALADETLAEAMAGAPFTMVVGRPPQNHIAHGETLWQQLLTEALAHRRARLAEYPVCDAEGQVVYLDCPLRVQCVLGGVYEGARRWLAPALRGRCHADFDLLAIQLTLDAILRDGRPRCANLSHQSMASSDFMARVTQALESQPQGAQGLWIDLPEVMAFEHAVIVREASRRWRPLGVRLSLEHAGERLTQVEQLQHLGLDNVRVDGALVTGLRGPEHAQVREHLQGIVRLVHEAGLTVTAEAVSGSAELASVWALGFDAATGPAVRPRRPPRPKDQSMSPQ